MPIEQRSSGAVQTPPTPASFSPQQAWVAAPHGVLPLWQEPPVHVPLVLLPVQVIPEARHCPPIQQPPLLQLFAAQQAWPLPPQVVAAPPAPPFEPAPPPAPATELPAPPPVPVAELPAPPPAPVSEPPALPPEPDAEVPAPPPVPEGEVPAPPPLPLADPAWPPLPPPPPPPQAAKVAINAAAASLCRTEDAFARFFMDRWPLGLSGNP